MTSWNAGDLSSIPGLGRERLPTPVFWPGEFHGVAKSPEFDPWVGKIPWRRKWQPIPVLLPGESHGGRSLVGYSPWGSQRVGHD